MSGHGKVVTFYWKKGQPFADYRDLFGYVYPSFALKGQQFNDYWHNCVCGNDNHPISDGPFYMASYTPGQGMVLKKNTKWYGKKSGLKHDRLQDDHRHQLGDPGDAGWRGRRDRSVPGVRSDAAPGSEEPRLQLHRQLHPGALGHGVPSGHAGQNPLMKKLYIRAGDRGRHEPAVADQRAVRLDRSRSQAAGQPGVRAVRLRRNGKYAYFHKYNYNAKGAIKLLKKHGCTGGPSAPSANNHAVWTCGGQKTEFKFDTTTRASRQQSGADLHPAADGDRHQARSHVPRCLELLRHVLPAANFDIGEYAWSGGPDPSGFDAIYQCVNAQKNLGGSNYKRYCNKKVDTLIDEGDVNFNPTSRTAQYEQVAKILADQISIIPLYASPQIFVYKKALKGASKSNNPTRRGRPGTFEQWHW